MRTQLTFAVVLIVSAASLGIQNAIAKGTPYDAGYSHGCSDAKLSFSARYINQPEKGPSFHTQEFMSGYNAGFNACNHGSSPIASNVDSGSSSSSSSLYKQGFARGISDANRNPPPTSTMSPNDVDCQNDEEPIFDEQDFCSGYQHGYASQNNKLLGR